MNYSTPDCSTCSNNASTSSWIAANPSHDNGSINAAHFHSALCVFFFDLAKHLHVAEKLIDSYRKTKDGKTLNPESAEFISSFSKNQPLIDFSWEPSLIQTETEGLRTTYEKINSLLKTFKSYDPGAYAQFFINHLALFKYQKQRYASELQKHEGSDEDFFVLSARAIAEGSQLGQTVKDELNSAFSQECYEEAEEQSQMDLNCYFYEFIGLFQNMEFDEFFDDLGISDPLFDEFISQFCNAIKLSRGELLLAFKEELNLAFDEGKLGPNDNFEMPVLQQTFSEKLFQPFCSFLALWAVFSEKQIDKILPESTIFSVSANETNFMEDLNTLKNHFISKMKKQGKLDKNFSLQLEHDFDETSFELDNYYNIVDLLEEDGPVYWMYLIERESKRADTQLTTGNLDENFKKELCAILKKVDPNYFLRVKPGLLDLEPFILSKEAEDAIEILELEVILPFLASSLNCNKFIHLKLEECEGGPRTDDLLNLFYFAEHQGQLKALRPLIFSKALNAESQIKNLGKSLALMDKITKS